MDEHPQQPANAAADSPPELAIEDLARAVLAREVRPRVGDVRRLAEAVLARAAKPKKDRGAQAKGGKKAKAKKGKLAKIPGQKGK